MYNFKKKRSEKVRKILIATRNNDKFKIVSKLLLTSNFKDYKFYSLNDINESVIEEKEAGDVLNRSFKKAKNTYDSINKNYDYIIGVDDGIKMKDKIIENVKEYIKPIIEDNFLSLNEEVYIVRAYTFINKEGLSKSIITEIPFRYIGLKKDFNILENSYPLSHVLSPINNSKTVAELSSEETNLYYLKYSKNGYDEVEKYFKERNC